MQYLVTALIVASALSSVLAIKERYEVPLRDGYTATIERDVPLEIVPREQWAAAPSLGDVPLQHPVPYLVVHHSVSPAACYTTAACKAAMRAMQHYHQVDLGWNDIGYKSPLGDVPLQHPVPYLVVHHSVSPAACYTTAACKAAMRAMQHYHQVDLGWNDIGYNFAIGSNGQVYEARGWSIVGTHAAQYNSRSLGIAVIGNWANAVPTALVFEALEELIADGVAQGHISPDYVMWGHRQAATVQCPARSLFDALVRFPLFDPTYPFEPINSEPLAAA